MIQSYVSIIICLLMYLYRLSNAFFLINIVLLLSNGKVITFGSNSNGQLGCSLSYNRRGPTVIKIPRLKQPITSVSAGSNHTALVSKDGKLYTFGSYSVKIQNQIFFNSLINV